MNFEHLLEGAIAEEFEQLGETDIGSPEYKTRVDTLTKFMDRAIEIEKCSNEREDRIDRQEREIDLKQSQLEAEQKRQQFEEEIKRAQMEEEKRHRRFEQEIRERQMKEERTNRIVTTIITATGIVLPIVVTIWGTKKSFEFEQTGTITTIMGRGFVNKLLPKK